jgi:hypothetical protein
MESLGIDLAAGLLAPLDNLSAASELLLITYEDPPVSKRYLRDQAVFGQTGGDALASALKIQARCAIMAHARGATN